MVSDEQVMKIAELANLEVKDSERKEYATKLSAILGYVESLKTLNTEGVPAMSHVHGSVNIFREDTIEPSLSFDEVKKIIPDTSGRFIRVPIIVD